MDEVFGDQLVVAALGAWLIERLKHSKYFPLISTETEKLNKLFSGFVAALATAGILVTTTWDAGSHTFVFSVTNLTVGAVASFLWHWAGQYIYLKFAYKGIKALNGKTPAAA